MATGRLDLEAEDKTRIGVMVGSIGSHAGKPACTLRGLPACPLHDSVHDQQHDLISAMEYGLGGPNMSIVTACATSNHNIGEAWRIMKFGDADVMVCGGAEATILPTGVAGFSNMKALSSRNDEPQRASRPYDVDRDGFVMGEGAGVVILETLEHAQKRGAKIYGELVGYGISADAYHLTAPDPEGRGAARCMKMALEHAGMKPEEIDYVNTHGTSTPLGDIYEIKAIKAVFGDHAKNGLLISSTKSMTGHLLGLRGSRTGTGRLPDGHAGQHHPAHHQCGQPGSGMRPGLRAGNPVNKDWTV